MFLNKRHVSGLAAFMVSSLFPLQAFPAESGTPLTLRCTIEVVHRTWSGQTPASENEPLTQDRLEEVISRSAPFTEGFVHLALPSKVGAFSVIGQITKKNRARVDLHLTLPRSGHSATTGWVSTDGSEFIQTERVDSLPTGDDRLMDMSCRIIEGPEHQKSR